MSSLLLRLRLQIELKVLSNSRKIASDEMIENSVSVSEKEEEFTELYVPWDTSWRSQPV